METFTREQIGAAYLAWEKDVEAGRCMADEEFRQLPTEERAAMNTEALVDYITGKLPTKD